MSKIRIGSIGIGGISRGVHLPGITNSPDMELVAVCDINPKALEYAQKTYGIKPEYCFTNYQDLINCPLVDAVDISTPNHLHFEMAMAAVKAGKHYVVEKPMTMDTREADLLAKATQEAGVKSMVCFSYRYKPAARYIKDLVKRGELGRIYHVDIQYYQSWGLPLFNTPKVWRFDKALTATGALGDLGSHGLDLMRFVTGQEYTRLVGHTGTYVDQRRDLKTGEMSPVDVDDFSNAMGEMTGGIAMTMRITRMGYGRGNYQMLEVYGDKGTLVYTNDVNSDNKDALQVCLEPLGKDHQQFDHVRVPDKYYREQMQCFADMINGCPDGLSATVEDGQINMHAVDAVLLSAEKGTWTTVE